MNALNIAFVYSWRLHGIVTTELIRQKDYRLKVISVLLKKSTASRVARSRPSITYKVCDEIRLDGLDHYPMPGKVRRCAVCKKSCRNTCEKCDQSMHVNTCFQLFHEK